MCLPHIFSLTEYFYPKPLHKKQGLRSKKYGETIKELGSFDNPFMFTGQWYDPEIGQYYLRARMYDPHLARFTSRDIIAGNMSEPITLHKYLYCGNNPINRVDPNGRIATNIASGLPLYAQGIDLAIYATESVQSDSFENFGFYNLAFFTQEFMPVGMQIATLSGRPHGLDVLARALKNKIWRENFMKKTFKDWAIGEGVERFSPTGLSRAESVAMDSKAYYIYNAFFFAVRQYYGISLEQMLDYDKWKNGD